MAVVTELLKLGNGSEKATLTSDLQHTLKLMSLVKDEEKPGANIDNSRTTPWY